jgi:hypothetical protein
MAADEAARDAVAEPAYEPPTVEERTDIGDALIGISES